MSRNGKNGHAPAAEKPLPQNLDAERSILGAVLLDNTALPVILKELPPEFTWFALEPHRKIYHAMLAMRDAGSPIDLVSLANELHKRGELEAAGGGAYIAQLVDGLPRVAHIAHYCQIVREKAQLRRALYFSHQLAERIANGQTEAAEIFADLRSFSTTETRFAGGVSNGHTVGRTLQQIMDADFPVPQHLIEGLIPRGSSVMLFAKPHSLKSWFTLALTLRATVPGRILGDQLTVENPVRTLLVSVEDPPSYVKERLQMLVMRPAYANAGFDPSRFKIIMRDEVPGLHLPSPQWFDVIVKAAEEIKADHIILDVVRQILKIGMDLNKPSDTAEFVYCLSELQNATGACVTICHHEKKGTNGIMEGATGSISLPSWSKVVARLGGKQEEKQPRHITTVELETDNSWVSSLEPMRLVLDLQAADPLRLEGLAEGIGIEVVQQKLSEAPSGWTLRDIMEAEDCSKSTAWRKVRHWLDTGKAGKIRGSKTAKGGMAHYQFTGTGEAAQ